VNSRSRPPVFNTSLGTHPTRPVRVDRAPFRIPWMVSPGRLSGRGTCRKQHAELSLDSVSPGPLSIRVQPAVGSISESGIRARGSAHPRNIAVGLSPIEKRGPSPTSSDNNRHPDDCSLRTVHGCVRLRCMSKLYDGLALCSPDVAQIPTRELSLAYEGDTPLAPP